MCGVGGWEGVDVEGKEKEVTLTIASRFIISLNYRCQSVNYLHTITCMYIISVNYLYTT